ncbi:MAG TPA: glutamine amidotransferase [Lacipirellulaceae bacterium]
MNDLRLQIQPVASLPVVIVIVLLLLGLLLVRPRHIRLAARQWAALVGLRLVVVMLTLLAMLRPALVYTREEPQQASLVLLVDNSRSMQVADSLGDKSRWDSMKLLLDAAAGDLAKLDDTWDVKAYGFDASTHKLDVRDGKLTLAGAPAGDQSAVGAAINDALDRETSGRVLAMLLMSDGAQRAVPPHDMPPQIAVRRLAAEHIPLLTFTFGKAGGSERADLAMTDLVTNESIFTEAPTEVRGQLAAEGYANQTVKAQLLWESAGGMEVVDTVEVDTGIDGTSVPVVLTHTPRTPGEYKVTLRVEPRDGELVTTNNEVSTFVTVRPGGIKVLYLVGTKRVGGGPGQEQRYVRAALARSPDIVVERRLINYDPAGIDLVEAIRDGDYNVLLLDDVDIQGLSQSTWQAIAERVRRGMGLAMLGGFHSFGPGGFRDSPIDEVLPINIGRAQRQNFGEPIRGDVHLEGPVRMLPAAPLGLRHPIMQISTGVGRAILPVEPIDDPNATDRIVRPTGDVASIWQQLPPLDGANLFERGQLKRNAQVLAKADDPQGHPLLVAGQAGDGRTLAFAGDSTWRWPMAGFADAHRRFWRQCVLWLAKKDEETAGRVWIRLAGRRAMRGTRVEFALGAEDAQGEPIDAATFDVVVEKPDGSKEQVRATKSDAEWAATFRETAEPGDYKIVVTGKEGDAVLGTAEARFLVPEQDLELDRPAAEPSVMAQLAEMTKPAGGAALAAEELPDLLKRLAEKPPELKEEVIARVTYWDTWPFFLLFVGLLGTEWFLRKRWGLV